MGPSPWGGLRGWSGGQNLTFSEYGHVAYQTKADNVCSNMVAYILPTDTPLLTVILDFDYLCSTTNVNPYKPSVLFVGHRQTGQTQIRCCRMGCLIRVFTVCSIKNQIKMKTATHQPIKQKWTDPIDKNGKFHSA